MKIFTILSITILFLSSSFAQAGDELIHLGSIGTKKETSPPQLKEGAVFRPIDKLKGEKFIFLPKPKSLQEYPYQVYRDKNMLSEPVAYEEGVGRIGVISEINRENEYKATISLKMIDNDGTYYILVMGDSADGSMYGLGSVADITAAKNKWEGKTLWLIKNQGLVTYDAATEKFSGIESKRFSPIVVQQVVAGWSNESPVRFICKVKASGEIGFVDINYTGTNVSSTLRDYDRFESNFLAFDPRIKYKWTKKTWDAISEAKVFVGMSKQQAEFSWGKPKDINRTNNLNNVREQWVYGESYLYFANGILSAIQN